MSIYSRPRKICFSAWTKSGSCVLADRSGPLPRWCSTPACGMHAKSCSCPAAGAWATALARRRTRTCSTAWCRLPVRAENQSMDYVRGNENDDDDYYWKRTRNAADGIRFCALTVIYNKTTAI